MKRKADETDNPFGDLISNSSNDSSDEEKNNNDSKRLKVESRNEEDSLSPSWTKVESREINERKKEVNELGRSIYTSICSVEYEDFKTKMENKDSTFIDDLTLSIETFIDQISMMMFDTSTTNWGNLPVINPSNCTNFTHHCHKETMKCPRSIPGYYSKSKKHHGDPRKAFIPQMYKILQDYGFFHQYLGYNMIDAYIPVSQLNQIDWGVEIGYKLGTIPGENPADKQTKEMEHLRNMKLRIRRVQFMRSFDVTCCLQKTADYDHIKFDDILQNVYNSVEKQLTKRINNPIT